MSVQYIMSHMISKRHWPKVTHFNWKVLLYCAPMGGIIWAMSLRPKTACPRGPSPISFWLEFLERGVHGGFGRGKSNHCSLSILVWWREGWTQGASGSSHPRPPPTPPGGALELHWRHPLLTPHADPWWWVQRHSDHMSCSPTVLSLACCTPAWA